MKKEKYIKEKELANMPKAIPYEEIMILGDLRKTISAK